RFLCISALATAQARHYSEWADWLDFSPSSACAGSFRAVSAHHNHPDQSGIRDLGACATKCPRPHLEDEGYDKPSWYHHHSPRAMQTCRGLSQFAPTRKPPRANGRIPKLATAFPCGGGVRQLAQGCHMGPRAAALAAFAPLSVRSVCSQPVPIAAVVSCCGHQCSRGRTGW